MEKWRLKIEFLLLHHFFILVNLYEFRTRKKKLLSPVYINRSVYHERYG